MAQDERLARALGWVSLGLGVPQLAAPRLVARMVGFSGDADSRVLTRLVGLREVAAGLGILLRPRPVGWLWARVAGDAMDLTVLGRGLSSKKTDHTRVMAATLAVVGITALDLRASLRQSRSSSSTGSARRDQGIEVRRSITVNRSPEDVYRFWHDFQNLPQFMQHLEAVQVTGDRSSHWKAKAPANTSVEWDAEVVDDRPNELIAWRSLPGASVDNAGTVRFSVAPGQRGTEVQVELHYTPPAGALGAAVAKLFGEEPSQQVADDLRALKQVLEAGEVVQSDASIHRRPHPAQPPAERERGA